jgi:hypothetical protein
MSYTLDKTNNNSPKITVADGTFDNTSTSLTLVGRAFLGWGEPFNENFLALLENFNDDKPPRSPVTGQLWYDSSVGQMKFYNGSVFTPIAALPTTGEGYLYNNGSGVTQWVSAGQLSSSLNSSLFPTINASSPTYNKTGYLVKNPDGSYSWVTGDTLLNGVLPTNAITNTGGGTGTGVLTKNPDGSYTWINLNTLSQKNDLDNTAKFSVPAGGIIMWSGTVLNIPTGWVLCDGTKGTPDLRDRFVIGAGTTVGNVYAVGNKGGSADAVVVSHTHTVNDPGHVHKVPQLIVDNADNGGANGKKYGGFVNDFTSNQLTGISIDSTGVSGTNANLPPYYALAFIMKT